MPERRALAPAALAGALLTLCVVGGSASAAGLPAGTGLPSNGGTCVLSICPLPAPTPAPPPPAPAPPPPATSSGSHGAPAPGSSASSPSGPAATVNGPGLDSGPSVLPGVTVDPNELLATQAQAITSNPIATQRPDLVHFRPPSSGSADAATDQETAQSRRSGPAGFLPLIAAAGAAALVLALVSFAIIRRYPITPAHRRALAVAPLMGAVQAGLIAAAVSGHLGGAAAGTPVASKHVAPSLTTSAVLSGLRTHSVSLPVGTGSRTWGSLVSIESALTSQQDRLVADEQTIAAVTPQLSGPTAGFARRPGAMGMLQNALRHAVADHQAVLGSYNASLEQEYSFFVNTAQSPQAATELKSVAEHTPPEVANAVTTDLNMVQTQLQQEAQIAAASGSNAQLPELLNGTGLKFHAPVAGVVTQPFGPSALSLEPPITYNGVFYPHFHTGLDIAAPLDTPVRASATGVVIVATSSVDSLGHLAGYGNYVVIGHGGGFMTLYGHLDKLLVSPGQTVQQGQVIGLLGSTGWSTGPHVHFEIRKNGMYSDPVPYIADDLRR